MPSKRYVRRTVDFINRTEMETLLSAPDQSTWIGRRDRAILLLALQTGVRVSELINLNYRDVNGRAYPLRRQGAQAAQC
jgi:integrase/recombinase XerD